MQFGYSILFVPNVKAAVDFYEAAFGLKHTSLNAGFATMDTGATTLAFGWEENEKKELGADASFRPNRPDQDAAGAQISFIADDVHAAYAKAIAAGATAVYGPRTMPWGQTVSRVRDLNGMLVSIVTAPRF